MEDGDKSVTGNWRDKKFYKTAFFSEYLNWEKFNIVCLFFCGFFF